MKPLLVHSQLINCNRLRYLLMNARNGEVTTKLKTLYANEMHGKSIDVFCVSNSEYEKCATKGDEYGVKESGIPALRRCCHLISADASLLEAKNFILSTLPGLLESVKLWIQLLSGQSEKRLQERSKAEEGVKRFDTLVFAVIEAPLECC